MKPIVIKLKGFIVKNPSPLLMAILILKKLREEKARVWIKKVTRKDALKMDREMMKETRDLRIKPERMDYLEIGPSFRKPKKKEA